MQDCPTDLSAELQLATVQEWETHCRADKQHYLDWGSILMNRALEGAQGGDSILICGAPNYGKSQLQTSLFIQILRHNRDAMIVDFTLDDPARKRLTQYAAHLSRIPMNEVDFINRADPEDEFLLPRYEMAVEDIREWMSAGRLKLFQRTMQDRKGNRMLPCRIDFIRSAVARIRSTCPDKKLVLGLDALNNVIVDPSVTDEYVTARMVADQLEDILTENNVLFVGTGHLRKNDGRRPGLDDLKGNNFLAYDLKVAIGVYNEAKRRCRSGATRTTWTKPAGPSLRPTS
jgi:hypothetical protein